MARLATLALPLACAALASCGPVEPVVPDRAPGERAPLSAMCDPVDPARCVLPWPSNTYTVADASRATGLRLALDPKGMPSRDEVGFLNLADGFSRLTPVMTAFPGKVPSAEGALRLLSVQPGAPDEGQFIPLRTVVVPSTSTRTGDESLLIGYPQRPLTAGADHVVVVMDSLQRDDGSTYPALQPAFPARSY